MRQLSLVLSSLFALMLTAVCAPASSLNDLPAGPAHVPAHVQVKLVPERLAVAPGGKITVAIEQTIEKGWHTYWSNPGDAGLPTTAAWKLPAGWQAGAIAWPYPQQERTGPLMDYGYENKVWLLVDLTAPATAKPGRIDISAHVEWLVCREVCVPEDATVPLTLFVEAAPAPADAVSAEQFASARARLPAASPWPVRYEAVKGDKPALKLFVEAGGLSGKAKPVSAVFFPARSGLIADAAPQTMMVHDTGLMLSLTPSPKFAAGALDGVLVLTSPDHSVQALNVRASPGVVPAEGGSLSLVMAMLFAFLGGIILNVMPCVLPVLAMKVLALARAGEGQARARVEAFAYGAGAIASFIALGLVLALLREAGQMIGWGFQMQEPVVVAASALLFLVIGLNLSGVFEINPVTAGDSLARRSGLTGAFFTGVLAVAVAAPCTAPFMATAIGFAVTQGPATALGVFAALGVGFALPFLLVGVFPALCRFLPKPGMWMVRLKQWLALPMYASVLWLIWVLAQQTTLTGLALVLWALCAVTFALFFYGRGRGRYALVALVVAVALAGGAGFVGLSRPAQSSALAGGLGENYTPEKLAKLRAQNRPVFVDASASWCISCLVNEEAALKRPAVRKAFADHHVAVLVADWTNRDPVVTRLLEAHGRSGVPLYVYYPAGAKDGQEKVLPQILTEDIVLKAISAP